MSYEDPIPWVTGALAGFGVGLLIGKHWEKGTQERKQIKEQIEKFQNQISEKVADPKMKKWIKENTPELMEFFKLKDGNNS